MESSSDASLHLTCLQQTLEREMPICRAMELSARSWNDQQLAMQMPLAPNRNHQYSAFAGSLSALCTITGWGVVFLLLREKGLTGNIVIRRSGIRYLRPVRSPHIVAQSLPADREHVGYFFELLESKGRSKIDVAVAIADEQGAYVKFTGSYVVQEVARA